MDRMTTGQFVKQSAAGLNSEFSFAEAGYVSKAKETSLPYYLPITGGRTYGFMSFPRELAQSEIQTASSRIWTRVANSIFNSDNYYAKCVLLWCNKVVPRNG